MDKKIQMVDLKNQYLRYKDQIKEAIQNVLEESKFINGPQVSIFAANLKKYLNADNVLTCGNGTDALQIALMALDLKKGDEIIIPAFNYISTAEVAALLGLRPVFIDVEPDYFSLDVDKLREKITSKTKVIVPVHLYGQCAKMEDITPLAGKYGLKIIEDNAQSIGAEYYFSDGRKSYAGSMGDFGCLSFFPAKNLGSYGDAGAVIIKNKTLADKARMIANHGQVIKYKHQLLGINSRLDTLQAAILDIKLRHLKEFIVSRQMFAGMYDERLDNIEQIKIPSRAEYSSHVFHQYTIKLKDVNRESIQNQLMKKNIPTMVYYPYPLHKQKVFREFMGNAETFPVAERLCKDVLSLPIHTEMDENQVDFISSELIKAVQNSH